MKIQTGQGTIPLITLIGIFSISALNALPGLAVSPILGDLNKIFPSATDLEIHMGHRTKRFFSLHGLHLLYV